MSTDAERDQQAPLDLAAIVTAEREIWGHPLHCPHHNWLAANGHLVALHDGICPVCGMHVPGTDDESEG
jgi:hypothetical protein